MSVFRFKQFSVKNLRSAMKVNTDGVLLGACLQLGDHPVTVLDAGTGTGTIALMTAQRLNEKGILESSRITGIDIDKDSAEEAGENFRSSKWAAFMECRNVALQDCEGSFDIIVSNPPFFDFSLPNPDERKNLSRHTAVPSEEMADGAAMSYRTLIDYSNEHLKENGVLAMILPSECETPLRRLAASYGLQMTHILRIRTTPSKAPSRIIVHLKKNSSAGTVPVEEELIIQNNGEYTPGYKALVKDFYLWG